jgi:hypothetical protein
LSLAPFMGPSSHALGHRESREPSPGRLRWLRTFTAWRNSEDTPLIDVVVSGGCDGTGLDSISITDLGGARSAWLTGALARAYRERGWRYTIRSWRVPELIPGISSGP